MFVTFDISKIIGYRQEYEMRPYGFVLREDLSSFLPRKCS